jgi:hypothetical protein
LDRPTTAMPCVQIAGHRPALAECARWRSPTVAAAVKSPSSALVPAARLPGSASWAFSGDLLHAAEPPPSSRRASSNPHSASRTLGAPPSAISSLGQLPTPAVGACGSVAVAGVRNPAQTRPCRRRVGAAGPPPKAAAAVVGRGCRGRDEDFSSPPAQIPACAARLTHRAPPSGTA